MTDTSTPNPSDSGEDRPRPKLSLKSTRRAEGKIETEAPPPASDASREPKKKSKLTLKTPPPDVRDPMPADQPATPAGNPSQASDPEPSSPRSEEQPAAQSTVQEAPPAKTGKAPPPVDPAVKAETARPRQPPPIRKILALVLLLAVAAFGGYFFTIRLQEEPASDPNALPTPPPETAAGSDPSTMSGGTEPAMDAGRVPTPQPPVRSGEPEVPVEVDPETAALVDLLDISMVRPHAAPPIIVLQGVAYSPGMLIDPNRGIRFAGFTTERREIVFEDADGARYFRYY